ncbi:MAG TPA: DUF2169 domain-containing protein, partial [Burkholderiales bacterium]|nr:DUF2169 domain-containing protein [Burkholderiales bacterium]
MNFPSIKNRTPFAFSPLHLTDEEGRPIFVPIVRATYTFDLNGNLQIAEKQMGVNPAGEFWGEPGQSSYKYEPDIAFVKLATDIALIGSAVAPRAGVTMIDVGMQVGPVRKIARVFGDRFWSKTFGVAGITSPQPFERIPLQYERAFGGWDRSNPDPNAHAFEQRNPFGAAFRAKGADFEEGLKLPNVEDPRALISGYHDRPPPTGFGFTSPDWIPRAALGGTYDKEWSKDRMPRLPRDFDRRYFNAASEGLVVPGFLKGDESVVIQGTTPQGRIQFDLPAIAPPEVIVSLKSQPEQKLQTQLDTVVINTDESLLFLTWRTNLLLRRGP